MFGEAGNHDEQRHTVVGRQVVGLLQGVFVYSFALHVVCLVGLGDVGVGRRVPGVVIDAV